MEYKEFIIAIRDEVSTFYGEEVSVILQKIFKNNSRVCDALLIQKPDSTITPAVYLEAYFEDYLRGDNIHKIAGNIVDMYERNCIETEYAAETMFSYEFMKNKIIFKIVNTSKNKKLLQSVPHREMEDLSIVYCFMMNDIFGQNATALIHDKHIANWNISEEELYELAYNNTIALCGKEFKTMNEVMVDLLVADRMELNKRDEIIEKLKDDEEECPMYVLTNKYKLFGASLIIYESILMEIHAKIGNFFIIPSSIHEVILVPEMSAMVVEDMRELVKHVNETEVDIEEVLSDNIYIYGGEAGGIRLL